ncbi:MAG: T9SS type A sorting domain-containing protein [Bacteroidales bacterium]|nr:T9SS type A sorting domain-containing protein [Bacteroidales bacterium]MCF8458634.1 T9SS type A sorting domain-containing protein [Bacteroidales bacterium]
MKNIYFAFVLLLGISNLVAQGFAPVGAEWHYNEQFSFSGDIDFIRFISEKDTLINGEICRKITKRHKLFNNRPDTEFLFTRNDTVFFLDTAFAEFQILYDFNADSQDSWVIKLKDETGDIDTVFVTVDSVYTVQINGIDLKVLDVTYFKDDEINPESYSSTINEQIGDLVYMFNWNPWTFPFDANWTDGLRCYEDSVFGLYETGLADSCEYVYDYIGVEETFAAADISIYPNPSTGLITVINENQEDFILRLFNLYGQVIYRNKVISGSQIDFSSFPKGLYFITIENSMGNFKQKIVLE